MHNRLSQRQCRSLLLTLLVVCTAAPALEAPPDTDNTYAIQTIASDGAFRNVLDFDLDRFERAHVAMIAANGEASTQTASMQLHYTRFDGVVWRDQVVTEFNAPLDSNDGAGLLAATLSERSATLPSFNMLFLDRGGPGVADDAVRLARAVGDTSTVESVHAGSAERGSAEAALKEAASAGLDAVDDVTDRLVGRRVDDKVVGGMR